MMDALEPIASASSRSRRKPEPRARFESPAFRAPAPAGESQRRSRDLLRANPLARPQGDRMTDDLTFEELPPGRYNGTVERVRYSFKAATHIVITYKLDTQDGGVRRVDERLPIHAPSSSTAYFQTALGKGRVEEILRTKGLSLADAQAAGGIRALPGLLEGSAICVVTRNRRAAGFNCPVVHHIEAL